jgi:hypothetical protein
MVLTKRDLLIVDFLVKQGFATFLQIQNLFFSDKRRASRRFNILVKNKILKQETISEVFGHKGKYFPHILQMKLAPQQTIYSLGSSMIRTHSKALSMQKSNMLLHQLLLNQVYIFVSEHFKSDFKYKVDILTEQEIKENAPDNLGRKKLAPDLSIEYGNTKIAVELERTIKSKARYENKIYQFDGTSYTHVWFIGTDDREIKRLQKKIHGNYKYGFTHIRDLNQVKSPLYGYLNLREWVDRVNQKIERIPNTQSNNSFAARLQKKRSELER